MVEHPLIQIRDLSVSFGTGTGEVKAVHRVSLDIHKGEILGLVGESGSGKSVTALSILQLLPYPLAHHPSGSIRFWGGAPRDKQMMEKNSWVRLRPIFAGFAATESP